MMILFRSTILHRHDSLKDSDNLPEPDVLAAEIVEDFRAALEQFREIAEDLREDIEENRMLVDEPEG